MENFELNEEQIAEIELDSSVEDLLLSASFCSGRMI